MSTEVVAVSTVSAEQQQSPSAPAQQNSVAKVNLLGMSRPQLEKFFEDMGEKKFRAGQVMKWIHQFFVTDFAEMTNISGKLREKLEKLCEIKAPEVVHKNYSKDGTRKWVFRVGEGEGSLVETVMARPSPSLRRWSPSAHAQPQAHLPYKNSLQPIADQ